MQQVRKVSGKGAGYLTRGCPRVAMGRGPPTPTKHSLRVVRQIGKGGRAKHRARVVAEKERAKNKWGKYDYHTRGRPRHGTRGEGSIPFPDVCSREPGARGPGHSRVPW